jgi:hypothetical protein
LISVLAAGLLGVRPVPAAGQAPALPEPTVLRADAAGVALEWRAPDFSLRQVTGDDGRPYIAVETSGWAQTGEPGQPQLPIASALAVVPPTGDVTLHVDTLERARRPLTHPVVPARASVPVSDPHTHVESIWARDEAAYTGAGPRPADVVALEEIGWLRGRRLVRLTYYPLRFDPARGALEVARRVRVELHFANQPPDGVGDEATNDPFTSVLQDSVVNPAQVTRFARPQRPAPAPDGTGPALTLPDPPDGADYLIIAHSELIDAVAPLANHRATVDGLRVFSTTVEAIYDAYSGGVVTSTAIKDYIAHAYDSWTPRPIYVLLVGDGVGPEEDELTRSQGSDAHVNYVPPYLIELGGYPSEGLVASDNRYVTVDGDDNLADLFIGRLPVNSSAETTTVVDKILSYELSPPQWPWNERVLFFAGNESDAPYHGYSDDVYYDHMPSTLIGRRVYFCTSGCDQPHEYDDIIAAHDATIHELNTGGLLASYVGHSSWHQWALDPETYAPMFHLDDVANLHNGGTLPVLVEMTCYTSRFSHPTADTLDESLVRQAGGGAVATWGPSSLGSSDGEKVLHQSFFDAVFQDGTAELGPAIEHAKLNLMVEKPYRSYLCDTFILLGDPAMDLNLDVVPWTHGAFLPLALRGN